MLQTKTMVEMLDIDKKNFPWLLQMETTMTTARTTKREISIISVFVSCAKDRTAMKMKIQDQKSKAEKDCVYDKIHKSVQKMMTRAEAGRDLGPIDDDTSN